MSTKNIARTAIEGGRTTRHKYERWNSLKRHRRAMHVAVQNMLRDPESADDVTLPVRPSEDEFEEKFADKLSAPFRWLMKHAEGMTAAEIRGLLFRHFDTSTLAGRHLVFGHLMPRHSSWRGGWAIGGTVSDFGDDGRLRRLTHTRNAHKAEKKLRIRARQWIRTFRKVRESEEPRYWYGMPRKDSVDHHVTITERIGPLGGGYAVFVPTGHRHDMECTNRWCHPRDFRTVDGVAKWVSVPHPVKVLPNTLHPVPFHSVPAYRPVRVLTSDEAHLWLALSGNVRHNLDLARNP